MQETEKEPKQSITVLLGARLILFIGILLGLLLLVIGDSSNTKWVAYTGKFILPVALFWGGIYLKEESIALRITLIAIGGIIIVVGLLGISSLLI